MTLTEIISANVLADIIPVNVSDYLNGGANILLVTLLIAVIITGVKGYWVPKFIFDREVQRADKATDASEKVTQALKDLTTEIRQRGSK